MRDTTQINFDPSDGETDEEDNSPFKIKKKWLNIYF